MAIKEIKREWSPCQLDYVKTFLLHSEKELKDLPKCCIGSKAIVSETDNEYFCTESGWKLGSELGGGETVILPETEMTPAEEGVFGIMTPLSATPTDGATAKIIYNGVEYTSPIILGEDEGLVMYVMGNTDMMGLPGSNTDAPFVVVLIPSGMDGAYGMVKPMDGATSVTLSIVQVGGAASGEGAVETMHVNITSTDGVYKADKPFATVLKAVLANKPVEFHLYPGALFEYRLHLTSLQRQADGGDVVIMNLHKFAGGAVVPYAFMFDEQILVGSD